MKRYTLLLILLSLVIHTYAQTNKSRKILIVATSADNRISKPGDHTWGCYAPEVTDFFARLYQSGLRMKDIDIVSPKGGKVPLAMPVHFPGKYPVPDEDKKAIAEQLDRSLRPDQVDASAYSAIYYSGGFSCLVDYPVATDIAAIAAQIYEHGGVVAAVCDGVAALPLIKLSNGQYLVAGKNIATNGYKSNKDTIHNALAAHGAIISSEKVVADRNVVSARGVKPIAVADKMLELLGYPAMGGGSEE